LLHLYILFFSMNQPNPSSYRAKLIKFLAVCAGLIPASLLLLGVDLTLSRIAFGDRQEALKQLIGGLGGIELSKLKKSNIGTIIEEGGLTSEAVAEGRHHDSPDYVKVFNKTGKVAWILGDSWGHGIKVNEVNNNTLAEEFSNSEVGEIRIIASVSYSPLLMNLAYRKRVEAGKGVPDIAVFFLDQTDIGDDFCRYRPYTWRDGNGRLMSVSRNDYESMGGARHIYIYKLFADNPSGFLYAFVFIVSKYLASLINVPGVTDCSYQDLLAWQLGKDKSPNGVPIREYKEYYTKNIKELIDEVIRSDPNTKIMLVSHDWAQHGLDKRNQDYMSNNNSSLHREISNVSKNISSLHLSYPDNYQGKDPSQVFRYPDDQFSHLHSYEILSRRIALRVKQELSNKISKNN